MKMVVAAAVSMVQTKANHPIAISVKLKKKKGEKGCVRL